MIICILVTFYCISSLVSMLPSSRPSLSKMRERLVQVHNLANIVFFTVCTYLTTYVIGSQVKSIAKKWSVTSHHTNSSPNKEESIHDGRMDLRYKSPMHFFLGIFLFIFLFSGRHGEMKVYMHEWMPLAWYNRASVIYASFPTRKDVINGNLGKLLPFLVAWSKSSKYPIKYMTHSLNSSLCSCCQTCR